MISTVLGPGEAAISRQAPRKGSSVWCMAAIIRPPARGAAAGAAFGPRTPAGPGIRGPGSRRDPGPGARQPSSGTSFREMELMQ
ncbi:hypothetical protein GCM10023079_47700 [Streptomyces chitinivorans]